MRYPEWEPYYREILEDFGFSEVEDRAAADLLVEYSRGKRATAQEVRDLIEGEAVSVVGNAPDLWDALRTTRLRDVVIAADGAASVLLLRGTVPDVVVTDLDGDPARLPEAEEQGALINVHAHGDNQEAIRRWVPMLNRVLPTCQCRPIGGLYNFGGFTDGDRAAFMADEVGAESIELVGFDFEAYEDPVKGRKLAWAKKLLSTLDTVEIL